MKLTQKDTYLIGALGLIVALTGAWFALSAGKATNTDPARNSDWISWRDSQPKFGKPNCMSKVVKEEGPNKGLHEFTCALVPDHRFYTPEPGVAPSDWLPEAPYVRKEPSQ